MKFDILAAIEQHCSADWHKALESVQIRRTVAKSQRIFTEGDDVEKLHVIVSGKVKVFRSFGNEGVRIIRLAADRQLLGHRSLGRVIQYPVSAQAYTETKLLEIPVQFFVDMLKANAEFCFHFMIFMAEELKVSENYMRNSYVMSVRERVLDGLVMAANAFGMDTNDARLIAFPIPRTDLAAIAGTRYESVIRVLAELKDQKIIEIVGKSYRLVDRDLILKELAPYSLK